MAVTRDDGAIGLTIDEIKQFIDPELGRQVSEIFNDKSEMTMFTTLLALIAIQCAKGTQCEDQVKDNVQSAAAIIALGAKNHFEKFVREAAEAVKH